MCMRGNSRRGNPKRRRKLTEKAKREAEEGSILDELLQDEVLHIVMTQYLLKKGMALFGDEADESVVKEFTQLHNMDTIIPVHRSDLTSAQRRAALRTLMFLKRKRDGSLKSRACADGSVQRPLYTKAEVSSPTVATESVMLTAVVDAHEGRDVAIMDIPGAFLHTMMDDLVHMRLTGKLAELMVATVGEDTSAFV